MKQIQSIIVLLLVVCLSASAEDNFTLQFPTGKYNNNVGEVLAFYMQLTGKKVIYDSSVQGPCPLLIDAPVSRDKAIELVEKALFANHFCLVDVSADTIQVVGLTQNPRSVGVPTISKEDGIPVGERVFTYIFKLQHRDPREVQQLLGSQIAPSMYTSFIADQKSGTVVVTERTSVIRSLLPIVAAFDVAQADRK